MHILNRVNLKSLDDYWKFELLGYTNSLIHSVKVPNSHRGCLVSNVENIYINNNNDSGSPSPEDTYYWQFD